MVCPTAAQIDPYLNVDAGTMSPFEHGEVFVLDDGGETDLVRASLHEKLYSGSVAEAAVAGLPPGPGQL